MELLQLYYFQVVAKLEHMTKAAEMLRIAQPALSKTISRLEADLGAPLFDRQGRQIKLNAYGKVFLAKVNAALGLLEEGKREVADLAGLEHGQVYIATTAINRFSDLFGSFASTHAAANFKLTQTTSEESKMQLLLSGEVDFAITYCLPADFKSQGIASIPFLTEQIWLAVPPGHRLVGRESIHLHEAASDAFIVMKEGHRFRQKTDALCQQAGFTPKIICDVNDFSAISGLVQAGMGVSLVTSAPSPRKDSTPHLLRIHEPVSERTFQLAWLQNRYLSRAAQAFRDYVTAFFPDNK
ncbi:LysR family transcriptional regulator [Paenibacillus planticolens]|uniref:LysR family transcriptional regulator n=1 Tax=Paenibacillus planticolens TaxID=2654976 RepID=A0ABX1ZJR3_9BACL|nr:LysR family transcriptional regulator [Paenibacillus planticolens]NOU99269.1 LysR family transcriptional regulator [Paenibacillus planticolens]